MSADLQCDHTESTPSTVAPIDDEQGWSTSTDSVCDMSDDMVRPVAHGTIVPEDAQIDAVRQNTEDALPTVSVVLHENGDKPVLLQQPPEPVPSPEIVSRIPSEIRPRARGRQYTAFGKTQTLAQWANEADTTYQFLHYRMKKGQSLEMAVNAVTPTHSSVAAVVPTHFVCPSSWEHSEDGFGYGPGSCCTMHGFTNETYSIRVQYNERRRDLKKFTSFHACVSRLDQIPITITEAANALSSIHDASITFTPATGVPVSTMVYFNGMFV